MASYSIINKTTGETKVISVSVHDILQWYKDNPEWERDWSKGCASFGEVGEWKDKLKKSHPGWNDVLKKVSTQPNSNVRPV